MFLINVPVGLVALGMVFVFLHLPSFGHASTRFDWWGATLIVATLRTTAPILLVALGGSFTTRAGIFNIGLEGQMLLGAFFAVIGTIAVVVIGAFGLRGVVGGGRSGGDGPEEAAAGGSGRGAGRGVFRLVMLAALVLALQLAATGLRI